MKVGWLSIMWLSIPQPTHCKLFYYFSVLICELYMISILLNKRTLYNYTWCIKSILVSTIITISILNESFCVKSVWPCTHVLLCVTEMNVVGYHPFLFIIQYIQSFKITIIILNYWISSLRERHWRASSVMQTLNNGNEDLLLISWSWSWACIQKGCN